MAEQVSKAVLITGCSTGIGRATALRLAARGHNVYASARRLDAIRDLGEQGCKIVALDVCDEASMRAVVERIEAADGAVGALVNNAGYGQDGAIEEVPMDAVRRQFETNVFGLVRLTQLVLPGMRRQHWGRIVNVGSMGGKLAPLMASVEERTRATYAGRTAVGPEGVARAIERAIVSKRPRSRYPVTAAARILMATRRVLPDGGWDALMRTQFATPKG